MFLKYPHLEKYKSNEVEGLTEGVCYVFPKLDGSNASVWYDSETNVVKAGSRNRELTLDKDNAGFFKYVKENSDLHDFLKLYPNYTLYGEWLVPHSIKTYKEDAWREFHVFDVYDRSKREFIAYSRYSPLLKEHEFEFIKPVEVLENPSLGELRAIANTNTYLIKEDSGVGEGVVVKNYSFRNGYGRTTWLKIIAEEHKKVQKPKENKHLKDNLELRIVNKYQDAHFVNKEFAKLPEDANIERVLHTIYYELVREHIWDMVKDFKNPVVDFKRLKTASYAKTKEILDIN